MGGTARALGARCVHTMHRCPRVFCGRTKSRSDAVRHEACCAAAVAAGGPCCAFCVCGTERQQCCTAATRRRARLPAMPLGSRARLHLCGFDSLLWSGRAPLRLVRHLVGHRSIVGGRACRPSCLIAPGIACWPLGCALRARGCAGRPRRRIDDFPRREQSGRKHAAPSRCTCALHALVRWPAHAHTAGAPAHPCYPVWARHPCYTVRARRRQCLAPGPVARSIFPSRAVEAVRLHICKP
jgi:hypothetical protein